MTTLAWPSIINPSRFRFGQRNNCRVHVSPLSGSVQTVALPGSRWTASMQWDRMSAADRANLFSLLAQLRGQANDIALYDLAQPQPQGPQWQSQAAAATNVLLQSINFASATWVKSGITVGTGITNPEGGGTDSFSWTGTLADSYIYQFFTPPNTSQRVASIWLKAPSAFAMPVYVTRSLPFAVVGSTSCNVTTAWQRFSLAFSPLDTTDHALQLGGGSLIGVGRVVHAYGPQIELGSAATPYVPTTTVAASRPSGVSLWGAAVAGANFIIARGFNIGVNPLWVGDKFSINGELKMVTGLTGGGFTGVFGHIGITFEPPLRAAVPDLTAITLDKPTARFMLSDPNWGMDITGDFPQSAALALDLVEVF